MKAHLINSNKNLFIRIPENIDDCSVIIFEMPKNCAGKTIKVSVIENDEAPFEKDAIIQENGSDTLTYYGEEDYWKPEDHSRVVVAENPECDYADCTGECHVVSCAVHQGFAPCNPKRIGYVRSDKLK